MFCFDADLEVGLGTGNHDFTEKFCEFSGMFRFFECDAFVGFGNFRISFAVRLTAHCEIHSDFGAFSVEVGAESFDDFRINSLHGTDSVFVCPDQSFSFLLFHEFGFRSFALRTEFRSFFTDVDIPAHGAHK